MTLRKLLVWLGLVIVLAGLSIYINRDWFARDTIQIYHRIVTREPWTRRGRPNAPAPKANPVTFGFNQRLELTAVRVVRLAEVETNRFALPVWELVSDSNSIPTKGFLYGDYIRGMRPKVANARPEPLEPLVEYRLFVEAGGKKFQHDFVTTPRAPQ